jgi:hypothetical protein
MPAKGRLCRAADFAPISQSVKKTNKNNWKQTRGRDSPNPANIAISRNKPSKSRMIWLFLINLAAGDGKS